MRGIGLIRLKIGVVVQFLSGIGCGCRERATAHPQNYLRIMEGSLNTWVNPHGNSSKLSDIPISARFCSCVQFQSQTFDVAFSLGMLWSKCILSVRVYLS